jgi:hypothetical protein
METKITTHFIKIMAESREDGEDNLSEFDQQLRTLNMDRAEMLAIAHKTKNKEAIAKYLSDKPRNFEALAKFSSVEAALHEVIYHDPIIGIRAIIAQCKKDGMPRKIADIFERLFLEEVYNKSWNPNLADPYTSENFHALVAKLRGIAIFFSMNNDFFRVLKRRFVLALAKYAAGNKMEINQALNGVDASTFDQNAGAPQRILINQSV